MTPTPCVLYVIRSDYNRLQSAYTLAVIFLDQARIQKEWLGSELRQARNVRDCVMFANVHH